MTSSPRRYPHETHPVGKTPADQKRNAVLLGEYEYDKYVESLTGYTGQDLQNVEFVRHQPAVRVRVGPRGNYKAGMTRLPDGSLFLAVCRNNNAPDPAQRRFEVAIYRSTDQAESWTPVAQPGIKGKEPALACAPDGTLYMAAQGGPVGAGTELPPDTQTFARSDDGGKTWDVSLYRSWDYPRQFIVEPDGTLMIVTAWRPGWGYGSEPDDASPYLKIGRSADRGKTWDFTQGKIDWNYTWFGEVGVIRLKDGRLLATLRRQTPETLGEGYEDSYLTESFDNGKTWSTPWPHLKTAQVHAFLTELHDGRLLCSFSNYHVPFGVSAIVSTDHGRTWDHDNFFRLALSNGYHVGWPVTLQLPDGQLVTTYASESYREQSPDRFVCETVRWLV